MTYYKLLEEIFNSNEDIIGRLLKRLYIEDKAKINTELVIPLANTGDSRLLFPFINLYNAASSKEEKLRLMQAICILRDPRSTDFLEDIIKSSKDEFEKKIIKKSIKEALANDHMVYRYNGSLENLERAKHANDQIKIDLTKVLEDHHKFMTRQLITNPLSYVVNLRLEFLVGGSTEEHVEIAKGEPVLSAGEVYFEIHSPGKWEISYINNRSYGYLPHPNSYKWIKESLYSSGIKLPEHFTEVFPKEGYNSDNILRLHMYYDLRSSKKLKKKLKS